MFLEGYLMKKVLRSLGLAILPLAVSLAWAADRASETNTPSTTYLQGGGSTLAGVEMFQSRNNFV